MTADDLERRAIIAAHDASCPGRCGYDVSTYPSLSKREQAIVEAWRADVDAYRCTCPPEPDETVTGQCPIHGDMSAQAQGQRDYEHMAKLRQEAADRAETAEAAIERVRRLCPRTASGMVRDFVPYADIRTALDGTETTNGR